MITRRPRRIITAIIGAALILATNAKADGPQPIKCPDSQAHVWKIEQCPRVGGDGAPGQLPGSGGPGEGGLLGLLHRLTGGLL